MSKDILSKMKRERKLKSAKIEELKREIKCIKADIRYLETKHTYQAARWWNF